MKGNQRRPRVALVQAPVFDRFVPSNSLALLSAHLKTVGLHPLVRDSSREITRLLEGALGRSLPLLDDLRQALLSDPALASRALDREVDAILEHEPDIVGFSVLAYCETWTLEMAERIKKRRPRCWIVLGGAQCLRENNASALAAHPAVDAVAVGEADVSFLRLAQELAPGARRLPSVPGFLLKEGVRVVDTGLEPEIPDLDVLPFMDFTVFPMHDYGGDKIWINSSRGCVRKCAFCTHIINSKTFRTMSARRTVAEIRHQLDLFPSFSLVEFSDSLVNGDVRRLGELSRLLVDYRTERLASRPGIGFGWIGQGILHPTMTPPLLQEMRRGGCVRLRYGLESGSQSVVDLMQKNFRVDDAAAILRDTRRAGISTQVYIMVGFPGEGEKEFRDTLKFLENNAAHIDEVSVCAHEIQKGSFVDAQTERYGVRLPLDDRSRWETEDGANTPEIRERRFRQVYRTAEKLGIATANKTVNRGRTGDYFPV